LIVVPRPKFAAPRRYLIVVPKPMSVPARGKLIVTPRLLPAVPLVVHRRYLIVAPGRRPRWRRSLCVAGTCAWCPGRCPRRRPFCAAGT
jgi:hypothetical protein